MSATAVFAVARVVARAGAGVAGGLAALGAAPAGATAAGAAATDAVAAGGAATGATGAAAILSGATCNAARDTGCECTKAVAGTTGGEALVHQRGGRGGLVPFGAVPTLVQHLVLDPRRPVD